MYEFHIEYLPNYINNRELFERYTMEHKIIVHCINDKFYYCPENLIKQYNIKPGYNLFTKCICINNYYSSLPFCIAEFYFDDKNRAQVVKAFDIANLGMYNAFLCIREKKINLIDELKREIELLRGSLEEHIEHHRYLPMGDLYEEAKESFEQTKENLEKNT